MNSQAIATWIYQAYLYIVSIIALIICIIGAVTLVNLTIKTVVFGVSSSWYEDPRDMCKYEVLDEMSEANEGRRIYESMDECIAAKKESIAMRAKYDIARDVSQGIAMVLVGFPVYFYHWRKIQKMHTA